MDIISFNEAATANGRIEKVIAQPDSVSGLVTMPSVVATGEVISIPTGRTVVHPNLQVDGTLDVQGTLFIPSGGSVSTTEVDATVVKQNGNVVANDSTVVHKTGDTMTGNLVFASGIKIMGDFSNASRTLRTSLQTSTVNGISVIQTIPNGTGTSSYNVCFGSSDVDNSTSLAIGASAIYAEINANKTGSATYPPMVFITGGAGRLRIDTEGNVLVTGAGGLGYGTGSGGTVTQLTSKSTAVTLNKPSGRIGTHSASLSAGAEVSFIFNNTFISTDGDTILLQECFVGAFPNKYTITSKAISHGSCFVNIKNNTVGSLSETVYINFSIIKGAIA